MPHRTRLDGWTLVRLSALIVAGLVVATLAVAGTESAGLRAAIRNTARSSLLLLFPAFVASSVAELWRSPFTKWLLRNRKYFGLGFAVSHFTHLAFIVAYALAYPEIFRDNVGNFGIYGGGTGYLFLIAMTITSFPGPTKWLGRRNWKVLHKLGMYVFWGIFASSYISRAISNPAFIPLALLVVVGVGLRGAARLKKIGRQRVKAQARSKRTA